MEESGNMELWAKLSRIVICKFRSRNLFDILIMILKQDIKTSGK